MEGETNGRRLSFVAEIKERNENYIIVGESLLFVKEFSGFRKNSSIA